MVKIFKILCLCLASSVLIHCTKDVSKDAPTEKPGNKSATSKPTQPLAASSPSTEEETPIPLPDIKGPVATVNGVEIPPDAFLAEMRGTLKRYQRARHTVKPQLRERLKDNLVRRLVDSELIKQKAKEMKIEVKEAQFEEKWGTHKKRYGNAKAFAAFLSRTGETVDRMKAQFRLNLLREEVFANVSNSVVISDKDTLAFYEKNKKKYSEREKIKASHILIRVDPKASDADKKKKLDHAKKVHAMAVKKGADFVKLASTYGEDPTKTRGGDLGYFSKGRMVKPFEEVAWKLKKDQISKVVKTQFGYHIIKKMDHKKASKKSFKDVEEKIARTLRAQKRNSAVREALTRWRNEAKIEIFVKGDRSLINKPRKALNLNRRAPKAEAQIIPKPTQPKK